MSQNLLHTLRSRTPFEEIDYLALIDALKDYKNPRDKISTMLAQQQLLRVKKGLYVFGPSLRRGPICLETLANLIYGPSYVSLDYAMAFYGFIPERVEEITSMTLGKNKRFATPLAIFSYRHLHPSRYWIGVDSLLLNGRYCLIASKEKALCDKLALGSRLSSAQELGEYLYDDLRVEPAAIGQLRIGLTRQIARCYKDANVELLLNLVSPKL